MDDVAVSLHNIPVGADLCACPLQFPEKLFLYRVDTGVDPFCIVIWRKLTFYFLEFGVDDIFRIVFFANGKSVFGGIAIFCFQLTREKNSKRQKY